ncbi:hypothetical protein [Sediminitomix flava]|uniref:Uncharacterized protein n=1 Tax=Sediminitomix flava TaxID=379075 RepID=A0A315Z6Q6_SEDFL|nr:hypothetical protein [Sediminitomix flava]PWJ38650.1 hypothetical protein BC781_107241 [Sediminitomix flava]
MINKINLRVLFTIFFWLLVRVIYSQNVIYDTLYYEIEKVEELLDDSSIDLDELTREYSSLDSLIELNLADGTPLSEIDTLHKVAFKLKGVWQFEKSVISGIQKQKNQYYLEFSMDSTSRKMFVDSYNEYPIKYPRIISTCKSIPSIVKYKNRYCILWTSMISQQIEEIELLNEDELILRLWDIHYSKYIKYAKRTNRLRFLKRIK